MTRIISKNQLMKVATVPVKYTPKANWGKISKQRNPEPNDKAPM